MALLAVEAVEKRFDSLAAVDGVTFGVDEGEILAVVGPNGAGKSTLLKAIGGIDPPSAGSVTLAGGKIEGLAPHQIRRMGIAMVMQTPLTFGSMSTMENVVLGAMFGAGHGVVAARDATRRAEEALSFVGLLDRADEPVGNLNLHEQRFLGMANALAGRPRVLLIDEVMAGLNDTELAASIQIVRTARDTLGVTVIWVEHVMKAVMSLAERVIVLDFGKKLADGEPEVIMRNPDVIDAYLGEGHDA
ncbi:MAG TPA: ABC transporter ATP-binding protein [Actinomycetota bacterium]|jgi:branched-chain amino acid transport system ATP-binding protein|nr:ABC transporter ATP-binding protein [Actinomycetota bacterium]